MSPPDRHKRSHSQPQKPASEPVEEEVHGTRTYGEGWVDGQGPIKLQDVPDTFHFEFRFDGGQRTYAFNVALPPGSDKDTFDMSTIRMERHGGTTAADHVFRQKLFEIIGSITAASGHIEASMKRLLVIFQDSDHVGFALVDHPWTELVKRLRTECTGADSRRQNLAKVLDWAEKHRCKEHRDTVVHGSWWLFDGLGATVSRWPRKEQDVVIFGELAAFQRHANYLWEFNRRLDELVGDDWGRAILAPIVTPPAFGGPGR
jgi:hypothetical protein